MSDKADLRELWDPITELITSALGGNTHFGYWSSSAGDDDIGAATDRLTDLVGSRLVGMAGKQLLDVGSGSGRPAARIAAATGAHVTGVTGSLAQHTAAQAVAAQSANVSFHHVPVDQMCFSDNAFDGAFVMDTLLYEADRASAVVEVARVLRPGGRLVIAEICVRESSGGRDDVARAELERAFGLAPIPDAEGYRALLGAAGMDVTDVVDISRSVRPTYAFIAAALRGAWGCPVEIAPRLAAVAESVEAFGADPRTGYLLLTAELANR
jgi:SAM-dependent methyltransferase